MLRDARAHRYPAPLSGGAVECLIRLRTSGPQESSSMPLAPKEDEICKELERLSSETSLAGAALIRRQASEIDSLYDQLSRAYMAVRGEIGEDDPVEDKIKQLRSSARKQPR